MTIRRQNSVTRACAITVMVAVAGCGSATPKVTYQSFPNQPARPDLEGHPKFKFAGSAILIDKAKDDKGKPTDALNIASVPYEDPDDDVIAIVKEDSLGLSLNLVLTHRSNSLLIDSVGTEIQDTRVKLIEQAGGIVAALVSAGTLAAVPVPAERELPEYPTLIEVNKYLKSRRPRSGDVAEESAYRAGTSLRLTSDTKAPLKYEVIFGALPGDAINRAEFQALGATARSVLFYSACRDATVTVKRKDVGGMAEHVARVKVADPNFLETAALPAKGKISMDTACGVNISSDSTSVSSNAELLNKLIQQAKAIDAARNRKE